MSKVLVISTSLRAKSNSDILTKKLIEGAKASGHDVEHISLKGKNIGFCIGCLACQNTQRCVTNDDAVEIAEKVENSDTLVFATPIYKCRYPCICNSDLLLRDERPDENSFGQAQSAVSFRL